MKTTYSVIHESDDDDGSPTCWAREINHKKYGKYVWISKENDVYNVEECSEELSVLVVCKTLTSAKRWISMNLV